MVDSKIDGIKEITPLKNIKDELYVEENDVLVAHTDLTQKAEIIGNPILILTKDKYKMLIPSMDVVKVVSKNKFISNYILYLLLSYKSFKEHALGYVSGTTVLHLSKKALKEFQFRMPTDTVLKNYITRSALCLSKSKPCRGKT